MNIRFFAMLLLVLVTQACSSGLEAKPTDPTTSANRPPLAVGVNVGSAHWWNNNRMHANLILGNHWQMALKDGNWQGVPPELIDSDGWLRPLPAGALAFRSMNHPNFTNGSADIICRYTGKGDIDVIWHGLITDRRKGKNSFRFRWQTMVPRDDKPVVAHIFLEISNIDPVDPIRNIDCRETSMDATVRFNPAFIASLRGFSVIRYLGVMNTATVPTLTWEGRKQISNSSAETADGMAIEDLVGIANEAQVSPWFILPYQADDEYQRRFADYVHKNLDPKLVAHVELGNEIWNTVFYTTYERVQKEGLDRGLSKDGYEALFRRYAQRLTEVMKIWTATYKDRPKALVRIAATQHVYYESSKLVLGFADTAKWVDALAIAPYFAFDRTKFPLDSGADNIFVGMDASIAIVLDQIDHQRAIADQYGVRLITYEAGQHIVLPNDVPLLKALNRDPRMEIAYRRYIDGWGKRNGDLMVLMQDVSGIGSDGAWGLREYLDQPIDQAPKARAAAAYLPAANKASK
jgi:hypothetical protein